MICNWAHLTLVSDDRFSIFGCINSRLPSCVTLIGEMALSRSKEAKMRMIYCFYIKWHNGRDFEPILCDKCVLKICSSANDSNQTIINFSRLKWFGTEIDTTYIYCSLIFMDFCFGVKIKIKSGNYLLILHQRPISSKKKESH